MSPGLIVICGPTATGKSSLAMAVARRLGVPILSADSRQVYRGFDIGTAKPVAAEQAEVPHYLIDLCSPQDTFTLARYQQAAQALIAQFHQQGQVPLLVGGTGLYIRAIVQGLQIPRVAPQPTLRAQLQTLGQREIYRWLSQVDPKATAQIHPHDQVRTLRALEVFYVTGIPLSQQQGSDPPDYPILQIGLDYGEPQLRTQRIGDRTDQMLAQGWLTEVQQLIDTYGVDLPLLQTLGYQEMKQYLMGHSSLAQAKAATIAHTRQFAKRQRTWFRAVSDIHWFESADPTLSTQVWDRIRTFLRSHSGPHATKSFQPPPNPAPLC